MKQLLTKYQFFTKLPQISHINKIVILKYIYNFLDQLLHPYIFHGRDMNQEYSFFISASCELLTQ